MSRLGTLAIRIYLGGETGTMPMADIKTTNGTIQTIEWCSVIQREQFYINGYTLIYDERPKRNWDEWIFDNTECREGL